jgi:hypothetical protein
LHSDVSSGLWTRQPRGQGPQEENSPCKKYVISNLAVSGLSSITFITANQRRKTFISSVADPDPGFGAFLTSRSGMGKKSGSGSGMNNPDHVSESLETIFWVKIPKFFYADPGSGKETSQIRNQGWRKLGSGIKDKHLGSATLFIPWIRVPNKYCSTVPGVKTFECLKS